MALNQIHTHLGRLLAVWITAGGLVAAEHHGNVKFGGLPVPGASVTATKGDKKVFTTTDENGRYSFADLADGPWTVEVEMLGFAKASNEVGVAFDAPTAEWNLKFLSLSAIMAPPAATAPLAGPATSPPAPVKTAEAAKTPEPAKTPVTKPAAPPSSTAGNGGAPRGQQANAGRGAPGGRGQSGANGGRPSLAAAGGFQRVDVNSAGGASAAGMDTGMAASELADLSNSADPSLLVSGSVSRGLDMPGQNDWFGGMGGRPDGMGGPDAMGGAFGMGAMAGAGGDAAGGGRGGAGGGMAGGRGGGPGMGGGGMPGGFGGGRGGGGMPGGGRGGRGDFAGRGGPMGRAGVAAFGNGRRDRRMQYNGNASFTLDNSALDAKSYSVNGQNTAKPGYAKGRGSFMFGGPLKIPKLLSGKRGTFTINYQMSRSRNGNTSTQTMPTLLERNGDFSQTVVSQGMSGAQVPVTIYDPTTGSPFPNNLIPSTRINPAASALLKYYPNPNAPGYRNNYQAPITTVSNSDNINSRLNQTITTKDRLNGGVGYQGSNSTTPNIFSFIDTGTGRSVNANVAWNHNFSSRIINNLSYTFSRSRNLSTPFFANSVDVETNLGITGTSRSPLNWGPPGLSFANYAGLTDGASSLTRNQTSSLGESLIWVKGVHNFTFGVDYRRQQINRANDPNGRGQFTFNGASTGNLVNGVAADGTGYDFASFLLGRPDTASLRYGNTSLYFRTASYDLYATDDWRISQKFSINFGLRWDYQSPITELNNGMANLDVAPGFAAVTPVTAGNPGPYSGALPSSLVRPDKNNISPRVGFAWRPIPKKSMVVRGGYGTYYNSAAYTKIANNMAQQPPLAQSFTLSTTSLPLNVPMEQYFSYLAGQNQQTNKITNTFAIDPNYRIGYAQMWQLSVQQDLGHSLVGTVTYNGTKGTHLDQTLLPNTAASGGKPNGLQSGYTYEESNGNSIYHGASFQLMRRFRNGVSANATYTYSKAIDNAVQAQDFLDTSAERAVSSSSRPHVVNLNWQYSTAVGRGGGMLIQGWKGTILKDWTLTNTISVGSGMPLTPTIGGTRSTTTGTGITGALRPDATGSPANEPTGGLPFNTQAFTAPLAGQWGNAGRDTIVGPTQFSLNAGLGRTFRVTERKSVDLRFDATNALNHVTFGSFNTTIGGNQVGVLSGASAMRSMQATLRFRF